jgi:hypothetical protein
MTMTQRGIHFRVALFVSDAFALWALTMFWMCLLALALVPLQLIAMWPVLSDGLHLMALGAGIVALAGLAFRWLAHGVLVRRRLQLLISAVLGVALLAVNVVAITALHVIGAARSIEPWETLEFAVGLVTGPVTSFGASWLESWTTPFWAFLDALACLSLSTLALMPRKSVHV